MSKLQLKKELAALDREQLMAMILDAYSARKEIKEYYDFFLNPDVEKLRGKYEVLIAREFARMRRGGYCKARISFIKQQIKLFGSFQPGYEAELELLFYTLNCALEMEARSHFPDTLVRGVASIMKMILDLGDKNLVADTTLQRISAILNDDKKGSRYFRRYLVRELQEYLALSHPSV